MKVLEAIHAFDCLKPNAYSQEQKVDWLDRLDCFVAAAILEKFPRKKLPLPEWGNPDRVLLMEPPFDEAYLHWLECKIHYYNEETDRYNAAVRMFRAVFEDYQKTLIRREDPGSAGCFLI